MSAANEVQKKVFSGSILMIASRLIVKSIGLVSSVLLARLLLPEDFGVIAIAMALYAFIELFGAFGFGTVLIQKQDASRDDYNTAWTFKVIYGVLAAICMFIAAPYVADFYQDPRLTEVVRLVGLLAILSGVNNIGVIDFQKQLDFKNELLLQVQPKILSFCATITLALTLRSYWALVLGMLINEALNLLFSYRMSGFRPRFSLKSANVLFNFSKWLMFNNLIDFVNRKMPVVLTGQMLDSKAVGLFTVGEEIALLPTAELAAPVNRATYPVYAKCKDSIVDLRRAFLKTMNLSTSISLPAASGIAVLAPLLVPTVLGPNWVEMTAMMQWLAIAGFVLNMSTNVGYVFMATGSPRYLVFINSIRALVFIPAFCVLVPNYGLSGIGYALLLAAIVLFVVTQVAISRLLLLGLLDMPKTVGRAVLASAMMCYVVHSFLQLDTGLADVLQMLLAVLLGVVSYCTGLLVLWHCAGAPEGFEKDVIQAIRTKLTQQ